MAEHPIEDLAARLERERREADRRYNDALTALDRALEPPPALPAAPSACDDAVLPGLNEAWDLLPGGSPRSIGR